MTVNVDTVNVDAEALKYMVAEEPSAAALRLSEGVVNELTNVNPPADVLDETRFSTLLPSQSAVCAEPEAKETVPEPFCQMTGESAVNARFERNTKLGLFTLFAIITLLP